MAIGVLACLLLIIAPAYGSATSLAKNNNPHNWWFPPPSMFAIDFSFSPATPIMGSQANFTAIANNGIPPYYFAWNFTDDNQSPQGQQVAHTFAATGDFKVILSGRDSTGLVVTTDKTVHVVPPPINVDFTFDPITPEAGTHVIFRSSLAGGLPPYTVLFDFGDHHTMNKTRSSHTYYSAGNYSVTLTVTDSYGQTSRLTKTVTVTPFVPVQSQPNGKGNNQQATGGSNDSILTQPASIAALAALGVGCAAALVFWRKPFARIRKR